MIQFTSNLYKTLLIVLISFLCALNLYQLIFVQNIISIIPLLLQIPILFFLYKKQKHLILFIKIWAILLLISGITGWLAILSGKLVTNLGGSVDPAESGIFNLLDKTIALMAGLYFLMFLKDSIEVKKAEPELIENNN
ncbi:MAG: hypothetical protein HF314_14545 [Ignavibacteria bacterium]|jgi:membrane protein insertase Oxa1/YidC/SpoIIIJ|nr:hypothetical protein [Ignavibacteria bacterium]MCU7504299.1 hypothetical protein [Ignavibacteria bacterium]MCU7516144.1 hypothetical protein [Ignavibacteria bacterium]